MEDEFLLLYDVNTSKNPEYPYWDYKKFCLEDKDGAECKTEFLFQKNDIPLLLNDLGSHANRGQFAEVPKHYVCC